MLILDSKRAQVEIGGQSSNGGVTVTQTRFLVVVVRLWVDLLMEGCEE